MADVRIRQLAIKTGVVRRLSKEKTVYEKEILVEKTRLDKFKKDGADEHVLKKQEEVIQECLMMLPHSIRRLQKELEVLEKFLEDEKDLIESKEYEVATLVANEAKEVLSKSS